MMDDDDYTSDFEPQTSKRRRLSNPGGAVAVSFAACFDPSKDCHTTDSIYLFLYIYIYTPEYKTLSHCLCIVEQSLPRVGIRLVVVPHRPRGGSPYFNKRALTANVPQANRDDDPSLLRPTMAHSTTNTSTSTNASTGRPRKAAAWEEEDRRERRLHRDKNILGVNAYQRHVQYINDYVLWYSDGVKYRAEGKGVERTDYDVRARLFLAYCYLFGSCQRVP